MFNGHMETIIPSMFFKVPDCEYNRERLELPDGDFLDIDWLKHSKNDFLMVISHGLEGSSDRYYVKRMATFFHARNWDVLAWNCRSCSGEMNRLSKFYHHGATEDLDAVIAHAVGANKYSAIVLVGSSMGGSMSIKYIGEQRRSEIIKAVVTFSVPCNLKDSAIQLQLRSNRFYEKRFVRKLIEKVNQKRLNHPELNNIDLDNVQDFDTFHERFTVPVYGFNNIQEFYHTATCDRYFDGVKVPILICNAANDPMLGELCYPKSYAGNSPYISLEIPKVGGHVGFTLQGKPYSYMELRTEAYLTELGLMP